MLFLDRNLRLKKGHFFLVAETNFKFAVSCRRVGGIWRQRALQKKIPCKSMSYDFVNFEDVNFCS